MDDFDIQVRTDGPAEARRLDMMIRDMEASLAAMRSDNAEKAVGLIIKQHRAEVRKMRRLEREMGF
jgi:hypothetical protein